MKSFDNFYYSSEGKLHDLEEIQQEYDRNNGNISKYRGKIYCPECRKAELSFTHRTTRTREFLSRKPTSNHNEECSYFYDSTDKKKEIKSYVGNLNDNQIEDRLESTLNYLLNLENKAQVVESNPTLQEENSIVLEENKNKVTVKRKTIPRKSINGWFDKSEANNTYIFYGTVMLEVEEFVAKNKKTYYRLLVKIKKNNDWKFKTIIYRGTIKDDIDPTAKYDLALLGYLEFYEGKPRLKTNTLNSILYRER